MYASQISSEIFSIAYFFWGRPKDMIKGDFQSYPDHRRDGAGASCTDGGRMGSGHGLVKKWGSVSDGWRVGRWGKDGRSSQDLLERFGQNVCLSSSSTDWNTLSV